MNMRLLAAIAGLLSLVPVYGSTIEVRPRGEGDNTVRADGTAGNPSQFIDGDFVVLVQPVRERDGLPPLNARRGMIEFDVFGSLGNPILEIASNWQPGDRRITSAQLHLYIDPLASTRGIGTYDVYGYRARNSLQSEDSADDPNREFVGTFTTRMNVDDYITVDIDADWLQQIWNQDINRLRPGFQIRAQNGAPNRMGIVAFNNDCQCYNPAQSPRLELSFASVPEPASVGLSALGLAASLVVARLRRK